MMPPGRRWNVDIGPPRRIIEVEPESLPLPEVLPEPQRETEPDPVPAGSRSFEDPPIR